MIIQSLCSEIQLTKRKLHQKGQESKFVYSDLLIVSPLYFIKAYFNHNCFKTLPPLLKEQMKEVNSKFFNNPICMEKRLFLPLFAMRENMQSICQKILSVSKMFFPQNRSSKTVLNSSLERSFRWVNKCSNKVCRVLKELSKFHKIIT